MKIHFGKLCSELLESEDSIGKGVYLVVRKCRFTRKRCVPSRWKVKIRLENMSTKSLESEDSHAKDVYLIVRK